jgi:hypothetical protein
MAQLLLLAARSSTSSSVGCGGWCLGRIGVGRSGHPPWLRWRRNAVAVKTGMRHEELKENLRLAGFDPCANLWVSGNVRKFA